jgi:uroporphyrinogen-III synthase
MPRRPHVLLLRTPREPDPYVKALDDAGFSARCVPVLRFEPVGRAALAERMQQPHDYAGLILTSPRAAHALRDLDLAVWRDHPTFVVGPATAAEAANLGLRPVGKEAGSAADLADVIAARSFDRPLLFLCGDRRRDALPNRLRATKTAFDERVIYRTVGDADGLPEAVERQRPDWLVFFSPSGVETADVLAGPSWNRIRKAAIGPTTADALRAAGFAPDAVAADPTPDALVAALLHAHRPPDA